MKTLTSLFSAVALATACSCSPDATPSTASPGSDGARAGDARADDARADDARADAENPNDAQVADTPPFDERSALDGATPGDADGSLPIPCRAVVTGIAVDERELAGYPPYALDACRLAYVTGPDEGGAGGDLLLRDLATGAEILVADRTEAPRRLSLAGDVLAWEATLEGRSVVRVRYAGAVRTVRGPFDHATEPRAAADGVAFTGWTGAAPCDDTDVALYTPATDAIVTVAGGPGQQRFADVSPAYVAFTDFSEDPGGCFAGNGDLADVAIYDRATRAITRRAVSGSKQAFPLLLSGDRIAYLHWEWSEVHPEPKFSAYHLKTGSIGLDPATTDREIAHVHADVPPYVRPAAHRGVLEWVDSPGGVFRLWRAAADASTPPAAVDGIAGVAIYAPAPGPDFTIVATRATARDPARLSAIAR